MKKSTSWYDVKFNQLGGFVSILWHSQIIWINTFFCCTLFNFGSLLAIYIFLLSFTPSFLLFCYSGFIFLLKVVRPYSIFILEMKAKLNGSLLLIKVDCLLMHEIHKKTQCGTLISQWFSACVFCNIAFQFFNSLFCYMQFIYSVHFLLIIINFFLALFLLHSCMRHVLSFISATCFHSLC